MLSVSVKLRLEAPGFSGAALPLCVVLGFGERRCFGQRKRLLQHARQLSRPLLDHLPDVSDPLLFGFHAGGLQEEQLQRYKMADGG